MSKPDPDRAIITGQGPALDLPGISVRFRHDLDLINWLLCTWHRGFGDGNALANTLCKPLGNAGLCFPNDVDELLRALRGAEWIIRGVATLQESEFGQSRAILLGSYGGLSTFEASAYGFTPNRSCKDYLLYVQEYTQTGIPGPDQDPIIATITIGTKVKLTPKFLTDTCQRNSDEADRIWIVGQCQCKNDMTLATDQLKEKSTLSYFSDAELQKQPCLKYRHIMKTNLLYKV